MARIAVVDDNATNRALVATVLSALGHTALEASNGVAGLELVRHERPDLVICDVLMPETDGYEFVRRLRQEPAVAGIPVVFYTADHLEAEARELARTCGVQEILTKPADPEEIVRVVERALCDAAAPSGTRAGTPMPEFDRQHLQIVTGKLTEKVAELQHANARLHAEIVVRERTQRQLAAQYAAARILVDADSLAEAPGGLLEAICTELEFPAGVLWRVDESGRTLRCVDAWCDPSGRCQAFVEQTRRLVLKPDMGVPGKVWASGETLWLNELATDADFLRLVTATRGGLHAGGAFPIAMRGRIAGVLEFFCAQPGPPGPSVLETVDALRGQLGQFFERSAQQRSILRLTRVYAVRSGINSAMVRIHERTALFKETCRVAVNKGGFGIAWAGEVDAQGAEVVPVAWAGIDDEMGAAPLPLAASAAGVERIVAEAVHKGTPVFIDDLDRVLRPGARAAEALRRGHRSMIALPLLVARRVSSVLVLYARERGFFSGAELDLLKELTNDLSFALEYIGKQDLLAYLALHDVLTGLPNRMHLQERLGLVLQTAQAHRGARVSVMVWNVDRFRNINDTLGRRVGDSVLHELAQRFSDAWPDRRDVARLGVDHFVGVIAGHQELTEVAHLVEHVIARLTERAIVVGDHELRVSVSAGIAVSRDGEGEGEADTLLNNAEAALRQAKRASATYLFYGPEMNALIAQTLRLENRLRLALEREEFTLHYQPKVDGESGRVTGVEALIRWNEPEGALVHPALFMPVLEETGMIVPVGVWALRRAIADARAWRAAGVDPPRIAVNVSAIQLQQSDFVEAVGRVLDEGNDPSAPVDLEITESMIMTDLEGNIDRLRRLRAMGVDIAIDDFGTGYSSLGYLAKLPVSALKIDRSFVDAMAETPENMTIVSTIVSLAHSLGLKVIAEGVEDEAQARTLRLFRCDELQGFLISRPLPSEGLVTYLRDAATRVRMH